MAPKFLNVGIPRRVARRKFAWISIISIQVVTLLAMYTISIDKLPLLANLLEWYFTIMGSIIGAYMGFATLDSHLESKNNIEAAKVLPQPTPVEAPDATPEDPLATSNKP